MRKGTQIRFCSEEDAISMSLEDFLVLTIDITENRKKRRELVGDHSPLRSFLLGKVRNKKRNQGKKRRIGREEEKVIAEDVWKEMRYNKSFFMGFSFEIAKKQTFNTVVSRSIDESYKKKEKTFSFGEVLKYSLSSYDIVNVLGIGPWKFVTLYLFREFCNDDFFDLSVLMDLDFNFSSEIIEEVLEKEDAGFLLSEQKLVLMKVLKKEEEKEKLLEFKGEFLKQLRENVVCLEFLKKIHLNEVLMAKILSNDLRRDVDCKKLATDRFRCIKIIISIFEDKNNCDCQIILRDCYLSKRCERVAKLFSSSSSESAFGCLSCPQRAIYYLRKSRECRSKYETSPYTQCSLHNSIFK